MTCVLAVSLATAWFVSNHTQRRWKATAQVLVVQRAPVVASTAEAAIQTPSMEPMDTQQAMLQSYSMAVRTINWLKNQALAKHRSTDAITFSPETLQKATTVAVPSGTNLVDVTIDWPDRDQALELANATCYAFIQWKKEMAAQSAKEALDSLKVRVGKAKQQMLEDEQREIQFRKSRQLVDVQAQQSAALQQYNQYDNEVVTLQRGVAAAEARVKSLSARLNADSRALLNAGGLRDDGLISTLQGQLNDLESKRADLAQHYTPTHPAMVQVARDIQGVRGRLDAAVRDALTSRAPSSLLDRDQQTQDLRAAQTDLVLKQSDLAAVIKVRDRAKARLATIPIAGTEHERLVRQVDLSRSLYKSVQGSLSAMQLNQDTASANIEIAQYANGPMAPFRPIRARDIGFGAAVGLFLSIVAALILESSDKRVRSIGIVRKLVPGPVVGVMPRLSRREMQGLLDGEIVPSAIEAYSLARANMALAIRQATQRDLWHKQVILVTSAMPGEGKSVTAAGIARSIARSGRSVVLVDADLRRPTQNDIFNTAEEIGLADVLSGGVSLDDAIVASDNENLAILHSGRPLVNPTELISQPAMAETMARLRDEADVVIIDAPACSVVADSLLLAPHADCVLQVIGAGQVDEQIVLATSEALLAAEPKSLMYFVNRLATDRARASHAYYYAAPAAPAGALPRPDASDD